MNHGSLFSGIGGFDLAAQWIGWTNIFQVEIDNYCNKVLEKHFPDVKRFRDIYEFDGTQFRGSVDIISGGFPCQPFSQAGKRQGTKDDRYLWPQMLRIIREVQPAFVVGENVAGLISMENGRTLERIFADLEDAGYRLETFVIPACAVGTWHRRDRIWIVAYCNSRRWGEYKDGKILGRRLSDAFGDGNNSEIRTIHSDSTTKRLQRSRHKSKKQKIQSKKGIEQLCKDVSDSQSKHRWDIKKDITNGCKRECRIKFNEICEDVSDTDIKRRCSGDTTREYAKDAWELSRNKEYGCWQFEPSVCK
jgi:DNA-cytosine methyltransferase